MFVPLTVIALFLTVSAGQEGPGTRIPQKGDTVVVKGCFKGSSLEATETAVAETEAVLAAPLLYRLRGDKALLKKMKQHENKVLHVTGVLKSTLPQSTAIGGKTVGRTRITIGVGSSQVGSPAHAEANRSIPVLEVKSYEGEELNVTCGG